MDECTSAVSTDVEGLMYEHAKSLEITLITISHKPSLVKYHDRMVRLSADGRWTMEKIGSEEEKSGTVEKELAEVRRKLDGADEWKARLEQIAVELAFKK